LVSTFTDLNIPDGYNLTGTVLLLLNIPLLIMVLRVTNKTFPVKSIINIVFMTTSMAFVPIPDNLIIHDTLTACIVGGVVAGFGVGLTLRCGGSSGGSDLIGVYCSVKYPNFTVGKVILLISMIVYSYCLIRFDINTVVYSAIYTIIYAHTVDFIHHQNIKTSAFIFSTNPYIIQTIVDRFGRGATRWEGKGVFSDRETHIFISVVSKYEVPELKRIIANADPKAFVILNNKVDVYGNFKKML